MHSLGRTMESILSKLKPEAAYFAPLEGKRGGMIFFDLADPSQIVESVEPFFLVSMRQPNSCRS